MLIELLRAAHRQYIAGETGRLELPPIAGAAGPVKVGATSVGIGGTSATVATPAGLEPGDTLIIHYAGTGKPNTGPASGKTDPDLTPPAGFESFHFYCGSGDNWCTWVMSRTVDGTEGASFTASTANSVNGVMLCLALRGLDPATPIVAVGNNGSDAGGTIQLPATGTSGYDAVCSMLVQQFAHDDAPSDFTWPAGWDTSVQGAQAGANGDTNFIALNLTPQRTTLLPAQSVTKPYADWTIGNQYALRVAGSTRSGVVVLQSIATENPGIGFPSPVSKGSTLLVGQMVFAGTISGPPTDSLGLTYVEVPDSHASGPGGAYFTDVAWYTATVPDADDGAACFVNQNIAGGYQRLALFEVVGKLDKAVSTYGTDSGGTHGNDAGTLTTSQDGAFIAGLFTANGTNGWQPESFWAPLIEDTAGGGGTFIASTSQNTAGAFDAGVTTGNTGTPYSSSAVAFVPPVAPPGAPTGVSAVAGNAQATVAWTPPASDGGGAITHYVVTPYIGGVAQAPATVGAVTSAVVTGLTNGTAYTFTVAATNSAGTGAESGQSAPVTPITVPSAPTGVTAVAGDTQATVSWTAPASDGGSAITEYVVTPYAAGVAQSAVTVPAPATSATITGLTNRTSYTFSVAAVNAAGTGPAASSLAVTPVHPTAAPPRPGSVELGVSSATPRKGVTGQPARGVSGGPRRRGVS